MPKSHEAMHPSKMFKENPSLGFRDIGLHMVKMLKEGKRIAVIDPNECKKTRLSYIKLLQKKCHNSSVAEISILPKYGCEQLFWTRELRLAMETGQGHVVHTDQSEISISDAQIMKWFNEETDCQIHYRHGIVEQPLESEECKVIEKCLGIYTKSVYKFEVPVMLVQWEVISGLTSSKQRMSKFVKSLELWTNTNQCGRVIIICDGSEVSTGEKTEAQQQKDIDDTLCALTKQFTQCPVYVFYVCDPKRAGCYVIPPKPGILAFLQQRHSLNLHSRRTLYIYETSSHMKMAENAGVRHIKATRLLDHPSLVMSSHAATTPSIPEMLMTKKIIPLGSKPPSIPLAELQHTYHDGKIQQKFPHGRCEYLYAADDQIIQRYNDMYVELATEVGKPGTKMSPKTKHQSTPDKSSTSHAQPCDMKSDQSKLSVASRDLPKWMMKKNQSNGSVSSGEVTISGNEVTAECKIRKTVYVMTEKELVEVACDVLKQAGKDIIVEEFLSKKLLDNESDMKERKPKNSGSSSKCGKRVETTHTSSNCKSMTVSASLIKTRANSEYTDLGNQLGSYCPKLEPESDMEDNGVSLSVHSDDMLDIEDNSVISSVNNDGSADETEQHKQHEAYQEKEKIPRTCNDDIVADVLDDFSTSPVLPKPSPRKRARNKTEPELTSCTPFKQRCLDKQDTDIKGNSNSVFTLNDHTGERHGHRVDQIIETVDINKRKKRLAPDLSHLDDIF